jgi:urease accessory protein
MGAPSARITAADFLTPPELKDRKLAENPAGRIGGVRLELISHEGLTSLGECYQQVPLRVLPAFQFAPAQPALLYLLNPTAGLMDGDAQLVQLKVGPRTRAIVTGQSATRIHPSVQGFSTQQWQIEIGAGGVLVVLPGPAIPFRGCRYYQRASINLADDAALLWGDIWLAGRYARGAASERFQFTTLIQDLTIYRQGRHIFRDRFCWQGPWDEGTARWHFGDVVASGTLFVTGPKTDSLNFDAIRNGGTVFPTACADHCFRWQGTSEEVTHRLVKTALTAASCLAGNSTEAPWLMKNHDLAANHWFSSHHTCDPVVGCRS